jgi:hypothetical protein
MALLETLCSARSKIRSLPVDFGLLFFLGLVGPIIFLKKLKIVAFP